MKAIPSLLIIAGFVYFALVSNGHVSSPRALLRKRKVETVAPEPETIVETSLASADVVDYIQDGEWDGSEILGVSREDVVRVAVRPSLLAGAKPEERKEWLADRIARNVFSTKTELVGACAQEFGVTDRTVWSDLKEMNAND